MKIYLAAIESRISPVVAKHPPPIPFALATFYAVNDMCYELYKSRHITDLMLDSGAFTFISRGAAPPKKETDDYVNRYISDINKHGIKNFFELDIDKLVGIGPVEQYREQMIRETGKEPIVVWHRERGLEYFVQMCKDYNYVAIGSPAWKEDRGIIKQFPWFINTAHKFGAKIHGLGFTNTKYLKMYDFDSVDSSSWLSPSIYGGGKYYQFTGDEIAIKTYKDGNLNIAKGKGYDLQYICFSEWVKYSKYMDTYRPKTII
jgi:hypothetical protein